VQQNLQQNLAAFEYIGSGRTHLNVMEQPVDRLPARQRRLRSWACQRAIKDRSEQLPSVVARV
jgi:hypothetical protein